MRKYSNPRMIDISFISKPIQLIVFNESIFGIDVNL